MSEECNDARKCLKCGAVFPAPTWCNFGQAHQFFPSVPVSDKPAEKQEGYPSDWARVELMVSPSGREFHAVGGEREKGEGDTAYIGRERILNALSTVEPVNAELIKMLAILKAQYEKGESIQGLGDTLGEIISALSASTVEITDPQNEIFVTESIRDGKIVSAARVREMSDAAANQYHDARVVSYYRIPPSTIAKSPTVEPNELVDNGLVLRLKMILSNGEVKDGRVSCLRGTIEEAMVALSKPDTIAISRDDAEKLVSRIQSYNFVAARDRLKADLGDKQ